MFAKPLTSFGIVSLLACGSATPRDVPTAAPLVDHQPLKSERPALAKKSVEPIQWSSMLPRGSVLRAAALDREGDIILAPTMAASGTLAGHELAKGLHLITLKKDGKLRWKRHVSQSREALVRSMVVTEDGDYVVAGTFAGKLSVDDLELQSQGDRDAFVALLSRDGKFLWMRSLGGLAREQATTVAISDEAQRISIGGWAESSFRFAGKEHAARGTAKDGFIATYDFSGTPIWAARYQGVGVDEVHALAYEIDALTVLGSFSTALRFGTEVAKSHGEQDLFCARYDPEGELAWMRSWGSDKADWGVALQVGEQGQAQLVAMVKGDIGLGDRRWPTVGKTDLLLWTLSRDGDVLGSQRHGGHGTLIATDAEGEPTLTLSGYYRGRGDVAHLKLPATEQDRGFLLRIGPELQLLQLEALEFDRLLLRRQRFGSELRVGLKQGQVKVQFQPAQ